MDVSSRVHRTLRHLKQFVPLTDGDAAEWLGAADTLGDGEHLLGAYQNHVGRKDDAIIVTSDRLIGAADGGRYAIRYADIVGISVPGEEKAWADRLTVTERAGKRTVLIVSGGEGQVRDVFEFSRFLRRAASDVVGGAA
jgi:hypothetical protein